MCSSSVKWSTIHANSLQHLLSLNSNINSATSIDTEKTAPSANTQVVHTYPDGGTQAWLVVLGVTSGVCATFGFVNAWGFFQAYYQQNFLRTMSPSDIAWIGSVQYALCFMPGLATGRLFDMGYLLLPVFLASALVVTCTFLTAECTEFWQFLLCQGVGIGLGTGVVFVAGTSIVPHWFNKNLGLALACMTGGVNLGATIFPLILKKLIEHLSFQWTLRITGFIITAFLIILNLTLARRLPPNPNPGPFVDLSLFKSLAYCVYCAALFTGFLGLYTCLTYISTSALLAGFDSNLSFYLLSIANVSSLFGRLGTGLLADHYGPLNVMIPSTLLAGIMTYVWPFARREAPLITVAILYGLSSGIFVAMMPQPTVRMGAITKVGMRSGMAYTIMSVGALAGPPISGAIFAHTGTFNHVGFYAGSAILASTILLTIVRHLLLGKLFGHA